MTIDRPPPCDVVGPDGYRWTVYPAHRHDRARDLAAACGFAGGDMVIDGDAVTGDTPLVATPLRQGAEIADVTDLPDFIGTSPTGTDLTSTDVVWEVAVVGGPSCGRWRPLPAGRHLLGRTATAAVRLDDPGVELHLGHLDVARPGSDADGSSGRFRQLTGRAPVVVGSRPCSGVMAITVDDRLTIGASAVAFRQPVPVRDVHDGHRPGADPWRSVLRRRPTPAEDADVEPIAVPLPPTAHRAPAAAGLVGAGIAAVGAGVMSVVLGHVLFAVFALVAALGSVSTWAVGALVAWRHRRRDATAHRRETATSVARMHRARTATARAYRARHLSIVEVLTRLHHDAGSVWRYRTDADDPPVVTLGLGDGVWSVPISAADRANLPAHLLAEVRACETLTGIDVPLVLAPETTVAFAGDLVGAAALARSIVVQLAFTYGPADLGLVIVADRLDDWSWVEWLPHGAVVVGADDADDVVVTARRPVPITVVVTDVADALTVRTGALRRFLAATHAATIVVTSPSTVPSVCDRVLEVGATGALRWSDGGRRASRPAVTNATAHLAGITIETAASAARRLAPLIDPEIVDPAAGVADHVTLDDLGGPSDTASIVECWSRTADPPLRAAIGLAGDEIVEVDLVADGPHSLVAGTTGSGKSELLRTLVVGIAARTSPDHVTFVLIDFKGGSTFDACSRLPHTVGVVTDLDEGLAERALTSLEAELTRRERLLRASGAEDLTDYRRRDTDPLPRLVVVVDEFASLARDHPDFLSALVGVAQRGRSLGIHLILATQRPAGVVTDDIRANTSLRVALRVHDRADAVDVVGDESPARFARSVPGRAALRLGADDPIVFQAASCTGPARPEGTGLRVVRHGPGGDGPGGDGPGGDGTGGDGDQGGGGRGDGTPTELSVLVDAICMAALEVGIAPPHRPWLPPLPEVLHEVPDGAVGLVDDPARQRRSPLCWHPGTGNLLLVGSLGSGTTTAASALARQLMAGADPSGLHLYVVDGRGDPAWEFVRGRRHCGALIGVHEPERLLRLVRRLERIVAERTSSGARCPQVVVVVDGLGPVRHALAESDVSSVGEVIARWDRVVADGPSVGVSICATTDGVPASTLHLPATQRWRFRVDAGDGGGAAASRPSRAVPPGRCVVVESGLEAQVGMVARPDGSGEMPHPIGGLVADDGGPEPIGMLPAVVDADEVEGAPFAELGERRGVVGLVVGLGADDLQPERLELPVGDHVFIGGAARSGTSSTLDQLVAEWQHRRRGEVLDAAAVLARPEVARERCTPLLVVADDADRIDDPTGVLTALARGREPMVTIVAAARLEAVRSAYGHWVREVARSRCGLIMTSTGDVDGELLGAALPRRSPIAARPGLAWLVDGRGQRLVQVALRGATMQR